MNIRAVVLALLTTGERPEHLTTDWMRLYSNFRSGGCWSELIRGLWADFLRRMPNSTGTSADRAVQVDTAWG